MYAGHAEIGPLLVEIHEVAVEPAMELDGLRICGRGSARIVPGHRLRLAPAGRPDLGLALGLAEQWPRGRVTGAALGASSLLDQLPRATAAKAIEPTTLLLLDRTVNVISLAGVVVNNAIVLIDYTIMLRNRRREELNLSEDEILPYEEVVKATIQSGKTRLRPVLLTAITTILGLVPLAIGFNIDFFSFFSSYDPKIYFGGDNNMFFAPMSWTIIYGLTFATFLTLIIIPSLYLITYKLKAWIYRKMNWKLTDN